MRDDSHSVFYEAVLCLDGMSIKDIKCIGELSMLAMLGNLFQMALLDSGDGLRAGAVAFSEIVQHQQMLMAILEEKYGIELKVDEPNEAEAIALMSKQDAYNLGHHDVLMREIRLIQSAKAKGQISDYARNSWKRLKSSVEKIMTESGLPEPDGGWIPEDKSMITRKNEAWTYIWLFPTSDGQPTMIARIKVDSVLRLEKQK